jgi:hypothetical protein
MLGGAMKNLVVRAGVAVLGVAVMLAWWTIRGDRSDSTTTTEQRIPTKLWEGGGATLTVDLETSDPAKMYASFGGADDRSLEASEEIAPGRHSWTLDLPADCSVFLSPTAREPKLGAKMSWTVTLNGHVIAEENNTLTAPLKADYAFGLSLEIEDIAQLLSELGAEGQK